jgi:hypothetical protein
LQIHLNSYKIHGKKFHKTLILFRSVVVSLECGRISTKAKDNTRWIFKTKQENTPNNIKTPQYTDAFL